MCQLSLSVCSPSVVSVCISNLLCQLSLSVCSPSVVSVCICSLMCQLSLSVCSPSVVSVCICSLMCQLSLSVCSPSVVSVCICSLEEVDVSRIYAVTDRTVALLASCCPRLRLLALCGCWRVTDHGITSVPGPTVSSRYALLVRIYWQIGRLWLEKECVQISV